MISIIIPVLNESTTIKELIFHLTDNASLNSISEIVIVDGGSTDGTQDIINQVIKERDPETSSGWSNQSNILLIDSPKGRAKQMNAGARKAKGHILYFLHADSFPPHRYDTLILNEVKKGNNAGCFRMQFDSNHWWLRTASWLTQFNWRACRGGDQSLFVTRQLFNEIGGYDERYIIYEDNILINALFKRNEFVVINKKLKTSARMYRKHGIWKVQYHFWTIYVKKWFGASAEDLHRYYKKTIAS